MGSHFWETFIGNRETILGNPETIPGNQETFWETKKTILGNEKQFWETGKHFLGRPAITLFWSFGYFMVMEIPHSCKNREVKPGTSPIMKLENVYSRNISIESLYTSIHYGALQRCSRLLQLYLAVFAVFFCGLHSPKNVEAL